MTKLAAIVLVLSLVGWTAGCRSPANEDRTPPAPVPVQPAADASPPAADATPPGPDPARWACQVDTDCMNSCAAGAVNAAWYRTANVRECEDGCANQVAAPPRCLAGSCVAFQLDPHDPANVNKFTRADDCTHRR